LSFVAAGDDGLHVTTLDLLDAFIERVGDIGQHPVGKQFGHHVTAEAELMAGFGTH